MHPYESLDARFFWSSAVAKRSMFDIAGVWIPKFRLGRNTKVSTFGSCFAQHIGRAIQARGFTWYVPEGAPQGLSKKTAEQYNYGIFSARTGNIYTVSLLQQWVGWATSSLPVPEEVWEKDGRFYDPFRPTIEPNGFASQTELVRSREAAIEAFRTCLTDSQIFVFTLGLTESWINKDANYEYPMCPGTTAGEFDPQKHKFVNQSFPQIRKCLNETLDKIRSINPTVQFLLTVSPVPLTATMSGNHVLVATTESKSILRAVAGATARQFQYVDYFPSYELINATPFRGVFFEPNQRTVNHVGVEHVMSTFFKCLIARFGPQGESREDRSDPNKRPAGPQNSAIQKNRILLENTVCDEELLDAFAKRGPT